MSSPEIISGGTESNVETLETAQERSLELAKQRENAAERSPEQHQEALESARKDAHEALMHKEKSGGEKKTGHEPTAIRRVTKQKKDVEYKKTLTEIQSHMNAPSRTFSKIIHNPIIEGTSEFVGKTIARPNAILAGSTLAFLSVTIVYLTAKHYGYLLSGFETIGAFIVGWLIGIIIDYFRTLVSGGDKHR